MRISMMTEQLGIWASADGDYQEASARFAVSLTALQEIGNYQAIPSTLAQFARLAAMQGQVIRAERLLGVVEALSSRHLSPEAEELITEIRSLLGKTLGTAEMSREYTAGRAMTMTQAIAYAIDLTPNML